jgi:hypothetical protein
LECNFEVWKKINANGIALVTSEVH